MQQPQSKNGGWTIAFLLFLFVMSCLLFNDFRLVHVSPCDCIQWQDDEEREDDNWESWNDPDAVRIVNAIRKKV